MSAPSSTVTEVDRHLAAQVVLARYAAALDEHDLAALEALHDVAATWTFTTAGQPALALIEGRTAILDFVRGAPRTPEERQRHVVTNVDVLPGGGDEGEVEARGYLVLMSVVSGSVTIVGTGTIRLRLVRDADRWRILALAVEFDSAPAA
ncbi:nuclear transport factor 2 family protein [Clavibacter sp. Sh2141]|uniref:nuclear transport factor 2 family protein n=1 Tax=Clavibacter sp. Sh2141 TaxID=3395374 RepID=UPI0039BC35F6